MAENANSTPVPSMGFCLLRAVLPAFAAAGLLILAAYGVAEPEHTITHHSYLAGAAQ